MKIHKFTLNPLQENTYLVTDAANNGVIIDPGCYFQEEKEALKGFIQKENIDLKAIINTHAHLDHIMGIAYIKDQFDVPLYLHKKDEVTLNMGEQSAKLYGLSLFEPSPQPDEWLEEGQELRFGDIAFKVLFGPGHAPGHVAFYNAEEHVLIGGDIIFRGSYGRVDLPGGDFETLKNTINNTIFTLPEKTLIYTGHGPETTVGAEKGSNPINW